MTTSDKGKKMAPIKRPFFKSIFVVSIVNVDDPPIMRMKNHGSPIHHIVVIALSTIFTRQLSRPMRTKVKTLPDLKITRILV